MADDPGVLTVISVNSPRRFDAAMSDGLMAMSEHSQAVVVTPFTLMGAMAPVSLAAALTQQNAEALAGITLSQLAKPGSPVVYGAFTSDVDMKSGAPAFGTPENARATMACGQLARFYKMPYRASNSSASNAVDAQAAYKSQMSIWSSVLAHANLVYHGAGWMEGGLTASFEKIVLDVEMLQMMAETIQPFAVAPEDIAFDAIASVRPAAISSAPPIRWSATRPRSIARCCPTGAATKAGRSPAARTPPSALPRSGNRRWNATSSRRSTPQSRKRSRPTSPSARKHCATWIIEKKRRRITAARLHCRRTWPE